MLFLYGWFFGNFWGRDSPHETLGSMWGRKEVQLMCFPMIRPETSWCERWTELGDIKKNSFHHGSDERSISPWKLAFFNWKLMVSGRWFIVLFEVVPFLGEKLQYLSGVSLSLNKTSRGHRFTVLHPAMKSPKAMSYGANMRGWNNPSYSTRLFSAIYRGYFTPCITGNLDPLCGSRCLLWCKVSFPCLRNNYCRLTRRCGGEVLHQFEKHQKLAKRMFEKGWCALIVLLLAPIYRIEESRCFVLVVTKCYKLCGFIGDDRFMMPSHWRHCVKSHSKSRLLQRHTGDMKLMAALSWTLIHLLFSQDEDTSTRA